MTDDFQDIRKMLQELREYVVTPPVSEPTQKLEEIIQEPDLTPASEPVSLVHHEEETNLKKKPITPMKTADVLLRLTNEEKRKLVALARSHDRSMSRMVGQLIAEASRNGTTR
jgi:hypothetical protein